MPLATPTEQEKALANLRQLYANMIAGGIASSAQAQRCAKELLAPAIVWLEFTARNSIEAQTPLSEQQVLNFLETAPSFPTESEKWLYLARQIERAHHVHQVG